MTTLRVLVVDDDFRVARLHSDAIDAMPDCQVIGQARTAAEALRMAQSRHPDLVILDEFLPDAPGSSLLGRLGAPVIVVTAANDTATVRRALSAGAVNYILKPFDLDLLVDRVRAFARTRAGLVGNRPVEQADIDRALTQMRGGAGSEPPPRRGGSETTAGLIRDLLASASGPLTASQVAQAIGVSRVTAQRYLSDLAQAGRVTIALSYGSAGRPEHHYSWVHR
ncbi:response regulator [Intrasporangium sp. YIM S08009]|uniref:response regulator n=1 Tax=Intrasporangium zincisolvens TaxID=3080018 RepID=UPI002B05BD9B|nr:response regulator [Intrasporangium sp. YIM S08009]